MSQLRIAVDNYLRIRRALGFKLERAGHFARRVWPGTSSG